MTERNCGTCVACCVYPSVNEGGVNKSALKPCPKLVDAERLAPPLCEEVGAFQGMPMIESKHLRGTTDEGCTVYDKRPACCHDYHCAWMDGHGNIEDRPDHSGVVVDQYTPQGPLKTGLIAKPLWYGAEDQHEGKTAIENISRSADCPVLVLQFTEFRLLRVEGRGVI